MEDWADKLKYEVELYFKIHFGLAAVLSFYLLNFAGLDKDRSQSVNAWAARLHDGPPPLSDTPPAYFAEPIAFPLEWIAIYTSPLLVIFVLQLAAIYNWTGGSYIYESRMNHVNAATQEDQKKYIRGGTPTMPICIDWFYRLCTTLLGLFTAFGLTNVLTAICYAFKSEGFLNCHPVATPVVAGISFAIFCFVFHGQVKKWVLRRISGRGDVARNFAKQYIKV